MSAVQPASEPSSSDLPGARPLLAAKAALRQQLVQSVRALPLQERNERARLAGAHLAEFLHQHVQAGASVALYAATATELGTESAIASLSQRYRLAFPRVAGQAITFHECSYADLTAHQSRIREPLASAPPVQPDVIVLPGRAFDWTGIRLGHGAGYYDRTIAALTKPTLLIGFCHDFQVLESLPRDAHDRWVHWLITDGRPPRRCETPTDLTSTPHDPAQAAGSNPLNTGAVDPRSGAS